MIELTKYDNIDDAQQELSSQYQKPEFKKLMAVMGKTFNHMQDADFEIKDGFWIPDAENEQLNILGRVWDVLRAGRSDDDYRPDIQRASSLSKSGTPNEIKGFLLDKFQATFASIYGAWNAGEPAAYFVVHDSIANDDDLDNLSAAGVRVHRAKYLIQEDPAARNIITESGKKILILG